MTQLVISVRSPNEAIVAAEHGADIVDVKEPDRGAMGPADVRVLAAIQAAVPTAKLSFAAGELIELAPAVEVAGRDDDRSTAKANAVGGFRFAKAAPAGCSSLTEWRRVWSLWTDSLPADISKVAVVYADAEAARSPVPGSLMPTAIECGANGVLFDTHAKGGMGLFDVLSPTRLTQWVEQAHQSGVWVCFAGSLKKSDIGRAAACGSDLVAFRTAACRGGRLGVIDPQCVSELAESVAACS